MVDRFKLITDELVTWLLQIASFNDGNRRTLALLANFQTHCRSFSCQGMCSLQLGRHRASRWCQSTSIGIKYSAPRTHWVEDHCILDIKIIRCLVSLPCHRVRFGSSRHVRCNMAIIKWYTQTEQAIRCADHSLRRSAIRRASTTNFFFFFILFDFVKRNEVSSANGSFRYSKKEYKYSSFKIRIRCLTKHS